MPKYKVEITTTVLAKNTDEFAEGVQDIFIENGVPAKLTSRGYMIRSIIPIDLVIEIVAGYVAHRFLFDPAVVKVEKLVIALKERLNRKPVGIPINVVLRLKDEGFEVITEARRLNNTSFLENLLENLASIIQILDSAELRSSIKQVRLIDDGDKVVVVGYQGSKPSHRIDLASKKVFPIESD